jgi:hypothetical protein
VAAAAASAAAVAQPSQSAKVIYTQKHRVDTTPAPQQEELAVVEQQLPVSSYPK